MAPFGNDKNLIPRSESAKRNMRIKEAKKTKIANNVYNDLLEDALLQHRRLLIDSQDGMKALKEEYNWQIRVNQRYEKVISKVQELAGFNKLLEADVVEENFQELRESVKEIAEYIERKFNMTTTYQDTRKQPSLIQRITADDVMRKRWKWQNERLHFLPYEADDDKGRKDMERDYSIKYLGMCVRRPYKVKKSKLEKPEVIWPKCIG